MFKTLKNLFSHKKVGRVTPCAPSSISPLSEDEGPPLTIKDARSTAVPSPGGEGRDEGEPFSAEGANYIPIEPSTKRNGKIAKLPRHIRDHINRSFDSGQTAVYITEQLNKLPEVKAVLEAHFGGRPITQNNLSEWKAGGYRDWLARQELLYKQQEFAADANELAETAKGLPDSLFGMALLDYARLLKNGDKETPEEFEKKRKALSNMVSDIVRLRRCETQVRGVAVQEERLERDREKTAEEMFQKFMECASNPEIRRAFILHPMACMALQRRHFGLPPRPEDAAVLKEYDLAKEAENQGNTTDLAPSSTENSEAKNPASAPSEPEPSPEPEEVGRAVHCAPSSPPPISEDVTLPLNIKNPSPTAVPSPGGEGKGEGELSPAEERGSNISLVHNEAEQSPNSKLTTQNSTLPDSATPDAPSPEPPAEDYTFVQQLYAALAPAPHILAERNRRHEELRRQAEANRQARLIQSQLSAQSSPLDSFSEPTYPHAPKPSQPGFSPPPTVPFPVHSIFPDIHHPSDNRRCHTS